MVGEEDQADCVGTFRLVLPRQDYDRCEDGMDIEARDGIKFSAGRLAGFALRPWSEEQATSEGMGVLSPIDFASFDLGRTSWRWISRSQIFRETKDDYYCLTGADVAASHGPCEVRKISHGQIEKKGGGLRH